MINKLKWMPNSTLHLCTPCIYLLIERIAVTLPSGHCVQTCESIPQAPDAHNASKQGTLHRLLDRWQAAQQSKRMQMRPQPGTSDSKAEQIAVTKTISALNAHKGSVSFPQVVLVALDGALPPVHPSIHDPNLLGHLADQAEVVADQHHAPIPLYMQPCSP